MKVRDVMTREVVTVHVDASFDEIVEAFLEADVSGIPVVTEGGWLTGMITEADLVSREAYERPAPRQGLRGAFASSGAVKRRYRRKAAARSARDLMSTPVRTVAPDDSLRDATRRMLESGYKRLPVTEEGRIVGIISRHDVLHAFCRPDAEIEAEASEVLRGVALSIPVYDPKVSVDHGVALLEGTVLYTHHLREVEDAIAGIEGVTGVRNRMGSKGGELGVPTAIGY